MLEIPINFNSVDQTGNFTINEIQFDYWLRWNFNSQQWNIDMRTPDPELYVLGLTLAPNEFLLRQTGIALLPESEDFMLISPDNWMDMKETPDWTQHNYRFVHLSADEVLQLREEKYGQGAVENLS